VDLPMAEFWVPSYHAKPGWTSALSQGEQKCSDVFLSRCNPTKEYRVERNGRIQVPKSILNRALPDQSPSDTTEKAPVWDFVRTEKTRDLTLLRTNRLYKAKDTDLYQSDMQQRTSEFHGYGRLTSERGKAAFNERGSMLPPKKTRDLARSLVAREADLSKTSLQTEPASVRVYERLRSQLGAPVGVDGFQSLASRALAQAKTESPQLKAVQVMANGGLRGLGEVESQADPDEDGEVGVILIAQLLDLFLTLLGEATTLRLIEDLRLQADVGTESLTASADTADLVSEELVIAAVFEDLLLEINQLRKVSGRIENLAGKHSDMEEGLLSVAGNIRGIATVLDVFTLIRSKAGGSQEDEPNLQSNRHMN
jgi:hypothetical protein